MKNGHLILGLILLSTLITKPAEATQNKLPEDPCHDLFWKVENNEDLVEIQPLIKTCPNINYVEIIFCGGTPSVCTYRSILASAASQKGRLDLMKLLLEAGAKVNYSSKNSQTPLQEAARYNDSAVVKWLIEKGAQLNNLPKPPLMYAAAFNSDLEVTKTLLAAGADVNAYITDGGITTSILKESLRFINNPQIVLTLIENGANAKFLSHCLRGNTWCEEEKETTPLDYAVRVRSKDYLPVVDALLKAGADPNVHGTSALYETTNDQTFMRLIEGGAKLGNLHSNPDELLYHVAINNGVLPYKPDFSSGEAFRFLIKNGANVNFMGMFGTTPLFEAVMYHNNAELINELISNGADVLLKLRGNKTVLMQAAGYTSNPEIIELLVKAGVSVNEENDFGKNAIFYSCQNPVPEITKKLILLGADALTVDQYQNTPLMFTLSSYAKDPAQSGFLKVMQELIRAGLDINIHNSSGQTALSIAIDVNQIEPIEILIKSKVNINAKIEVDLNGETIFESPLCYAKRKNSKKEIITAIKKAGGKC